MVMAMASSLCSPLSRRTERSLARVYIYIMYKEMDGDDDELCSLYRARPEAKKWLCSRYRACPEAKKWLCSRYRALPGAKKWLCSQYRALPGAKKGLCSLYRALPEAKSGFVVYTEHSRRQKVALQSIQSTPGGKKSAL